MIVNPFKRVKGNFTMGGGSTWGQWGPSVNISAALPNSVGGPIDWWARGTAAGAITNGFRKGGSPNLFSVGVIQPPGGGTLVEAMTQWGDGTITWTDGPAGNVSGATTGSHNLGDADTGSGAGFRIQVPNAAQWPDWRILKVWCFDWPARRVRHKAWLDNAALDSDELWLDYYGPGPSAMNDGETYKKWSEKRLITTEILFAADGAGQTLTYDMTRTWSYYQSIYAVALYKAKPSRIL